MTYTFVVSLNEVPVAVLRTVIVSLMLYRTVSPGPLSVIRTVIRVDSVPRQLVNWAGSAVTVTDSTRGPPVALGDSDGRADDFDADGRGDALERVALGAAVDGESVLTGMTGAGVSGAAVLRRGASSPVLSAPTSSAAIATIARPPPASSAIARREPPSVGGCGIDGVSPNDSPPGKPGGSSVISGSAAA
ncbi:hypothetical protein GCM10022255_044130 [Dactylosporangium darangshiense]|uniref:Uncharacterized protein n=1 Tax=Dactylosporangium darangshiense TaxID=579108 RepID=A0ABP8DAQ4_9ACTN